MKRRISRYTTSRDLTERGHLVINRASYFDKKGKENNPTLGRMYSDEDLLRYICNVYSVLMTRGIRGTFVYACDPALRSRMRALIYPEL